MKNFTRFIWGLLGLIFLISGTLNANVINVSNSGNDISGNGTDINPYATIQKAVDISSVGDTIFVEDGIYGGPVTLLNKTLTLMSKFGPENCIIEGDGVYPTFDIDSSNVLIGGFSIIKGYAQIDFYFGELAVEHCYFDGSSTGYEKGITIQEGDTVKIHHNIFYKMADWAIYDGSGIAEIINNTFVNNPFAAVSLLTTSNTRVTNNIFAFNETGVQLDYLGYAGIFTYNDFWQNTSDISDLGYNPDGSNIYDDPMFVDTSNFDYGLLQNSPCIDSGDVNIFDKDGSRSDIGAIHFFQGDMPEFYIDIPNNCSPAWVNFVNTSVFNNYNGPVQYEWYLNEILVSNSENFDTSLFSGYYDIRLECYDTAMNNIGYVPKGFDIVDCGSDYVDFYLNYNSGCAPVNVNFQNNSYFSQYMGPVFYVWELNGDTISIDEYPMDTLLDINYYEIRLTAFDTNNYVLDSRTDYLDIYECPGNDINFSAYQYGYCSMDTVMFYNYSYINNYQGEVQYIWNINNEVIEGYEPPAMTLPGGNHHIRLEAYDTLGMHLGSYDLNLYVGGSTGKFQTSTGNMACPGQPVLFKYENDYWDLSWDMGDGQKFESNNHFKYTYNTEGVYTVTLIIEDECGTDTITQTITISNTAIPVFSAYSEMGHLFCPYDEITFRVEGDYMETIWTFDDGTMLNGQNVRYAFQDTGFHYAVAQVKNSCGNIGLDTVFIETRNDIEVYSNFDWFFNGPSCPFTKAYFNAHSAGSYNWDFGDGASSNLKNPVHMFAGEGTYEVKLATYNGCGYSDTATQFVEIYYSRGELYPEFEIRKENGDYFDINYEDTLRLCPGETVRLMPYYGYEDAKYMWNLGNGSSSMVKEPVVSYQTGGLKTITLKIINNCKDSGIVQKHIIVDPSLMPYSKLRHLPGEVCPSDEVFFFDFASEEVSNGYIYDIDFGDNSTPATGITTPVDLKINALATHSYTNVGTYNYTFMVTNVCNNTDTVQGTINVDNNAQNIPFYHVTNSTKYDDDKYGEIEDWSMDNGGANHRMLIPITWNSWDQGMSNVFIVYFWYGDFDPENDPGQPDGMVKLITDNIGVGDSILAYVPVKITEFHSVGIATTWYCDTSNIDGDPNVFSMPVDNNMMAINSFPIFNNGYTNLKDMTFGNTIDMDMNGGWDGKCDPPTPEGNYRSPLGNGNFNFLNLWSNEGSNMGDYSINQGTEDEEMEGSTYHIISGYYEIFNDTMVFMPYSEGDECTVFGYYTFVYQKDSVQFTLISDGCTNRIDALSGRTFYNNKDGEYTPFYSSCPGDSVEFTVVGGSTYEWNFGEGTKLQTTERYVHFAYQDTGLFEAFVVISNSCNRTDTVYTDVLIESGNKPMAYFYMEPWDPTVGDTVWFEYEGWDPIGNYMYTWDFGDGSVQNFGKKAMHVYNNPGEYPVSLSVGNGCGSSMETHQVYVMGNNCGIEARFTYSMMGDTVQFINNSLGDVSKLIWDFGDGNTSKLKNPKHIFAPGIYSVCLSVIDTLTQCQDQMCMEIQVGAIDCFADFIFSKVDANNTLVLTDNSINAAYWSWDFGDGTTSTDQNPKHTYNGAGQYNVCLSTSDSNKVCSSGPRCALINIGIIDSTMAHPEFSYFADSLSVEFTDQSTGDITDWYWSFDDGNTSESKNVSYIFEKAGIYNICLSVYDSVSQYRNQVCKDIKVGTIDCQAKFTYFTDHNTNTVTFADNSLGAINEWLWDFGDGNFSFKQNPVYTYAQPGIYDVTLSVRNTETGCFSPITLRVTVGEVQDCFAEFEFFVDGLTVKFTDKSLGNITQRYWNFGNGTFGYRANPSVTYKLPGVKTVCYMVVDTITGRQHQTCKDIKVGTIDCSAGFTYFIDQKTRTVDLFDESFGEVQHWMWDFNNGSISFDTNASITYAAEGVYEVCQTVSNDNNNCMKTLCKEITIKDTASTLCNTLFTYAQTEGTREVVFKDATLSNVTSWFWDLGDGEFSKQQTVSHEYTNDGKYHVCLSTYNANTGCRSEKCKDIIVKKVADSTEVLDADFTFIPEQSTNNVKFVNNSTGNVTGLYWTFGDGSYEKSSETVVHNYGKPGNFQVCLYVVDSESGETSDVCKYVPVGEKQCNIAADFSKFIDPETRTVNFTDKTTGDVAKWSWSFGDGTTSSKQNPVHVYEKAGFYLVSLSVREANGNCSDFSSDFIQVGSVNCRANFAYSVDVNTNSLTVKSTSKGDVANWYWTFNDGSTANGDSVTHTFEKAGLYNVSLSIATTGKACADYTSQAIQVGEVDCNADFTVYVDSSMNKAYFNNNTIGNATQLFWQFGDGLISMREDPEHIYKAQGYYTVNLTTYDPGINCADHTQQLVLIGDKDIDCEADFYYQVDGRNVQFFNKSIGDNLSYFWWLGEGEESTDADPSKSYLNGGYYQVCLTVTTASGVQNTNCRFVPVDPPERKDCLTQFIYSVDSTSKTVTFTDQSLGGADKWYWRFGDDQESTEQNPVHAYTNPDFYKVRLVSGNTTSGCVSKDWQMINVAMEAQGLKAGFGYETDSLNLKTGGYPVDFVGVSAGKPARYSWDFGDSETEDGNPSPTHEFAEAGEYEVCFTIEDQVTGEEDQVCETIKVGEEVGPEGIEQEIQNSLFEFTSYPNPFDDFTVITYSIPYSTKVTITVFDGTGRNVKTLINTVKKAGNHTITWDAPDLTSGLYYINLQTQTGIVKSKMIVKK